MRLLRAELEFIFVVIILRPYLLSKSRVPTLPLHLLLLYRATTRCSQKVGNP